MQRRSGFNQLVRRLSYKGSVYRSLTNHSWLTTIGLAFVRGDLRNSARGQGDIKCLGNDLQDLCSLRSAGNSFSNSFGIGDRCRSHAEGRIDATLKVLKA
jgi:hypothetical protein